MNLRRWITALAILAVFTAVAGAQITPASQVTCTVGAMTTPNIRAEGLTERVGDLRLQCSGGLAPQTGNASDRMTMVVTYSSSVTSPADAGGSTGNDIMLVIDEPGTLSLAAATSLGIQGLGPNVGLQGPGAQPSINGVCTTLSQATATVQANCPAFAILANPSAGYWATEAQNVPGNNAINAYQGVVSGANSNIVTFTNVPLVPPVTGGVFRDFRIVNARVNPAGAPGAVTVSVTSTSVVGSSTLSVPATATTVANAAASITTSVVTSPVSSCVTNALFPGAGQAKANATLLKFGQNFLTAFKPRVVSLVAADNATGVGADLVTAPGEVEGNLTVGANTVANYSESGVITAIGGFTTGLANSGTRLKAVFTGLDKNVTYYVSLNNVTDYATLVTAPAAIGDITSTPFASLLTAQGQGAETALYTAAPASGAGLGNNIVPVAALTVSNKGAAEAVWEITNIKASSADTYTFALYAVYNSGTPPVVNPAGANTTTATVALGYAQTAGAAPLTPTWIPRFTAPAAGTGFMSVLPCQTTLLFPFVTSFLQAANSAWATGVAIENTGADPLGTPAPAAGGTCSLNFYGPGAPVSPMTVGPILPGTGLTFLVSDPGGVGANTNWTGYIFAVCNFNFGHGFAFIEDNTRSMAMGYLGEVLDSQRSDVQRGSFTLGEANAQ